MCWSGLGTVPYTDGQTVTYCQHLNEPLTAQYYMGFLFACFQSAPLYWHFICWYSRV